MEVLVKKAPDHRFVLLRGCSLEGFIRIPSENEHFPRNALGDVSKIMGP